VRLRRLRAELDGRLVLRWRAFPLRPTPDPDVRFAGTYREEAWRRCRELAREAGIAFRMWERPDFPQWSLPALAAAQCAARQGADAFEALHLRLYAAFFAEGVNIGRPEEVVEVVRRVPEVDFARFLADYESGVGQAAVLRDYEGAVTEHGVQAIPTVILPGGRRLVGAVPVEVYRRALAG
jgi:predicted DsbA family dithiol-disulfide isomerase